MELIINSKQQTEEEYYVGVKSSISLCTENSFELFEHGSVQCWTYLLFFSLKTQHFERLLNSAVV